MDQDSQEFSEDPLGQVRRPGEPGPGEEVPAPVEGKEEEESPYEAELKRAAKRVVASAVAKAVQAVIMEGRLVSGSS